MIRYAVLGSGSSANSYIIQHDNASFVIDNGFSLKEFKRRAEMLNFNLSDIKFIFLTHDHSDHLKGVSLLSKKYSIPVIMSSMTSLKNEYVEKIFEILVVENGMEYCYNNLQFSVFETSHDSAGSVSYSFNIKGIVFTIITDTGIVTDEMERYALNSDVLFLEANYCPEMLENGPYPDFLKNRIKSDYGHLSNYDAVDFLKKIGTEGKKNRITYFCHLSDKNNSSKTLDKIIKSSFSKDFSYKICRKGESVDGNPLEIK